MSLQEFPVLATYWHPTKALVDWSWAVTIFVAFLQECHQHTGWLREVGEQEIWMEHGSSGSGKGMMLRPALGEALENVNTLEKNGLIPQMSSQEHCWQVHY